MDATAPLRPAAREAACAAMDACGNPSSVHGEGRAARRLIEDARGSVAALAMRIRAMSSSPPAAPRRMRWRSPPRSNAVPTKAPRDLLLFSAIEHPSVLAAAGFASALAGKVPVDVNGVIDLAALEQCLAAQSPVARWCR